MRVPRPLHPQLVQHTASLNYRHVLKSRGHLTNREVKRVRLRTPTVEKCREEGHVELEPWSPVPRSTCRVGHISLHKSRNREKT